MLHPHTTLRFVNEQIGFGVFATAPIPAGTVVWTMDPLDQVLTPEHVARLDERTRAVLEVYGYIDGGGNYILCWDFARFVNHSCEANVLSPGIDVELAVRDIGAGEEICGDYGAYNIERDLDCGCRRAACRGTVRSADFESYADVWDAQLRAAATRVTEVEQPLWPWVKDTELLARAASDPLVLPTVLMHRSTTPPAHAPTRHA
ncbi:MAG: SET domain-containing protein [Myxococcales bacterium]|nr:SET domain-containing protein [Myxococcales bacterium]